MPFTIPSGIVTTQVSCLERIANTIPEIGILTTKSIGPVANSGNREPILAQYAPGSFVNAVGLTNPGAKEFARQLAGIHIPNNKFLLGSIFGGDEKEFVYVAKTLENHVDGYELNLSCPHAKKYGMKLGLNPCNVIDIVKAVRKTTNKPIFVKLTPNANNIGKIANAAINAGANGIVAINTDGPGEHYADGNLVLTNEKGGMSGKGIMPLGLRCVRDIRQAIGKEPLIIGMGGISTARDAMDYFEGGANAVGIGSALAGMDDRTMMFYLNQMNRDLLHDCKTNRAAKLLQEVDMEYKKVSVRDNLKPNGCNLSTIVTNYSMDAKAGQFVFAWIPGVGEKPFSIMDNDPLVLGVLERGPLTKEINSLDKGNEFYIRGPHGRGVEVPRGANVTLVGGGCGIAGLYLLAKQLGKRNNVISLLAAKDKDHIPYIDKFTKYGSVGVATEDGSFGERGLVTDLINVYNLKDNYIFNCGPMAMVDAVLPLELEASSPDKIRSSVDYMTRCGVGVCGSCADSKGKRTCVEGPFMSAE